MTNPKNKVSRDYFLYALIALLIIASFAMGSMWTRLKYVENGKVSGTAQQRNDEGNNTNPQPTAQGSGDVPKPSEADHIQGNTDAKVALIEYSDFDCPFCGRFHETAASALSEYGDQMMWVYRHFPLDSLHPEARTKAEASECVADIAGNDAFWEFTDRLFVDGPKVAEMESTVQAMGIDTTAFNECLDSGKYAQKVTDQANTGAKAGVNGTPGNFVMNLETGEVIPLRGAVPLETLKQTIDSML